MVLLLSVLTTRAEAMSKAEYIASLHKTSPRLICGLTLYGVCFAVSDDECEAKARTELDACIKANEKLIPSKFTVMTTMQIGRKIGACTGNHLRRKLPLKKNASATCRKFQQTVER
jgi:hypothetical protein